MNPHDTVYIVDDDPSIRDAIADLLDAVGTPTRSFASAEDFLDAWTDDSPGCLLLDVRLPGMTGTDFQQRLLDLGHRIPIVFMTSHGDIPMVKKVMKAGAIEFLTKPFQKEELLAAISSALALDRAQRFSASRGKLLQVRFASLTPREREVMHWVTSGYLNKQIAAELHLSEITVKLHRRQVMEKMQANSLADLVKQATELQVVPTTLCSRTKSKQPPSGPV